MNVPRPPHAWSVSPARAVQIQRRLAHIVIATGRIPELRLAAGADLAFLPGKERCIAGVVVWDVRLQAIVEQRVVVRQVAFPYVPGLLSFREAPALIAAIRMLRTVPDVFLFDGQGLAHPRRFGLACHMGVLLNRPTVGCAKSVLVGDYDEPAVLRGSSAPLVYEGQDVGRAVRTRDGIKPVYVSVGHRLSLDAAVAITLACVTRYRLPEPTRLADQLVSRARSA